MNRRYAVFIIKKQQRHQSMIKAGMRGHRDYNPITSTDVEEEAFENNIEEEKDQIEEEENVESVKVIILDSAQTRFTVSVNPDWTVLTLKKVGEKIHKVQPASQRLIFRGKMLDDARKLIDFGIDRDDIIIHLFPKPRLVVTSSNAVTESSTRPTEQGGAHIPSIVLDEEEQERRGQILVLGSAEIAEAQSNVKLLSLLLLLVCSMRLLALFSIAMGVAQDPESDENSAPSITGANQTFDDYSSDNYEPQIRSWQNSDYFDLLVSAVGFYVATLGMKATFENTLRLATAYMFGTVIAGIGWNLWNIFMYAAFIKKESQPKDDDEVIPLSRDDYVTVAFFTVMIPMLVWGLCFARAWEFRRLIEEAETEAAERIRSQLSVLEGSNEEEDDAATTTHLVV